MFRSSYLPSRGVKLFVNLIQTAINNFDEVVPPWFEATFTESERNLWAVMDIHNYIAWGACEGHLANVTGGKFKCNDAMDKIREDLHECLEPFAKCFAAKYSGLKSCTEFSLSTASHAA